MRYFDTIEFLEPKCPRCGSVISYGISTTFNETHMAHICNNCQNILS